MADPQQQRTDMAMAEAGAAQVASELARRALEFESMAAQMRAAGMDTSAIDMAIADLNSHAGNVAAAMGGSDIAALSSAMMAATNVMTNPQLNPMGPAYANMRQQMKKGVAINDKIDLIAAEEEAIQAAYNRAFENEWAGGYAAFEQRWENREQAVSAFLDSEEGQARFEASMVEQRAIIAQESKNWSPGDIEARLNKVGRLSNDINVTMQAVIARDDEYGRVIAVEMEAAIHTTGELMMDPKVMARYGAEPITQEQWAWLQEHGFEPVERSQQELEAALQNDDPAVVAQAQMDLTRLQYQQMNAMVLGKHLQELGLSPEKMAASGAELDEAINTSAAKLYYAHIKSGTIDADAVSLDAFKQQHRDTVMQIRESDLGQALLAARESGTVESLDAWLDKTVGERAGSIIEMNSARRTFEKNAKWMAGSYKSQEYLGDPPYEESFVAAERAQLDEFGNYMSELAELADRYPQMASVKKDMVNKGWAAINAYYKEDGSAKHPREGADTLKAALAEAKAEIEAMPAMAEVRSAEAARAENAATLNSAAQEGAVTFAALGPLGEQLKNAGVTAQDIADGSVDEAPISAALDQKLLLAMAKEKSHSAATSMIH